MPRTRQRRLVAPDPKEAQNAAIDSAKPNTVITYDSPLIGPGRLSAIGGFYPLLNSGFNPDIIDYGTYDKMRGDSMIRAALTLIKSPIIGQLRQAQAVSKTPEVKAFIQKTVIESGLLTNLFTTSLRSLEFGVAWHEKVWEVKNLFITYKAAEPETGEEIDEVAWEGPALIYKEIKEVNPATIKRVVRKGLDVFDLLPVTVNPVVPAPSSKVPDGTFMGFIQGGFSAIYSTQANSFPDRFVSAEKAFVYTHDKEYGNMWGRPRTKDAYPYFFWKQAILKFWMAWAEKKVVPPRIARYPIGRDKATGLDNGQIAINVLNIIDNVAGIALPSSRIRDVSGASSYRRTQSDWDIQELNVTDKSDTFNSIFNTLNIEILRAMFVPERVFTQGDTGAYAMAEAHTDTFLMTLDSLLVDILTKVNADPVKQLILVNFGPDEAEDAGIYVPGITDEEREFVRQVFMELLTDPDSQYRIDFDNIAERYGVPLKDPSLRDRELTGGPGGLPMEYGQVPPEDGTEPGTELEPAPTTAPPNLVLSDEEEYAEYVALDTYDPSRWTVEPDSTARLQYRVIDNTTGKRLSGFAGYQVIRGFLRYQARANKQAQTKAAQAQRKAESAAKTAQRQATAAAKHAANAATRAASKTARQAAQAAKQASRQAAQAAKHASSTAHASGAHGIATRGGKKQGVTIGGKDQAARNAADRATISKLAQLDRQQAIAAARAQHTAFPKPLKVPAVHGVKEFIPKPPKPPKQVPVKVVKAIQAQRVKLQQTTAKQPSVHAAATVQAKGWTVHDFAAAQKDAAIQKAVQLSAADLNNIYTIMKTADGWIVTSKPRTFIHNYGKKAHTGSGQSWSTYHLEDLEDEDKEEVFIDNTNDPSSSVYEPEEQLELEDQFYTDDNLEHFANMLWSIALSDIQRQQLELV